MRSILLKKDEYLDNFAESVYAEYLKHHHGVTALAPDYDKAFMRKEIISWELNEDYDALTDVSIEAMAWLPITYQNLRTSLIGGCSTGQGSSESCSIAMSYPYQSNTTQNIIEVNAGGCITRINVNPLITVSTSSKYEYTQSSAATVWTITHNLGFYPNVFTIDSNGREIEGVVTPVSTNTLQITFSSPVAGVAYLS